MGVFDFNNNRGQNLSNPKFDKDSVNFRTLQKFIAVASADTISVASGITNTQEITVSLTAGQIQSGSSIPIDTGIPIPGVGKAIEVVSASIIFTANTTPFTSVTLGLITDTAAGEQVYTVAILSGGLNKFLRFRISTTTSTNMVENKKLFVVADADSIGTGDGVAKIYILYRTITI